MRRFANKNFFSPTPLPLSCSKVCGETVVFSYFTVTSNIFHPDKPLSRAEYLHSKMIQTYEGKMEIRVLYEMSQRKLTNQMICYGGGNGQCCVREAES